MVAFIFKSLGDAKEDIRARASSCYVCTVGAVFKSALQLNPRFN